MTRVALLRYPGTWSERDFQHAFSLVPEIETEILWHEDADLRGFDAAVVPGGFTYGDYLRAGAIAQFAPAMEAVARHAAGGGAVLGICNGFQVLCESGLLPGALLTNESLLFVCRQVDLVVESADTAFTGECRVGDRISIPVKHQSGRYFAPDPELDALEERGGVVLRYAPGHNPNGSVRDIAGIANERGNVVGLMPHPEHAVDVLTGSDDGLRLFDSAAVFAAGREPTALSA